MVLTQETVYNEEPYYAISTTTGLSEEAVAERNRKKKAEHQDTFEQYYAVGVVNPRESFVYFAGQDAWSDFAEVIPALVEHEDFKEFTFDNFPIKAYLDFENEEDQAVVDTSNSAPLDYADLAGLIDLGRLTQYVFFVLAALIIVISYFVLIAKDVRKNGIIKRQKAQLEAAVVDKPQGKE